MKAFFDRIERLALVAVCVVATFSVFGTSDCQAQWGYRGRGAGGFHYRGPILNIQVAPAFPDSYYAASPFSGPSWPGAIDSRYSRYGAIGSDFDRYRMNDAEFFAPLPTNSYRGFQPTQAELDRERYYYDLDRTHRYMTREERYGNDFRNAYTPPAAMVDRHRYPYTGGSILPRPTAPVPGLSLERSGSRYEGYIPDDEVAVSLRAAANRLRRSLSRKSDGHVWVRHLQPERIIDAIDRAEFPGSLSDLIVNYEGVAENPRLVLISESEGFQDVRRLLAQYVTLNSRYPNADPMGPSEGDAESWPSLHDSPTSSVISDTVISEQVIGEQVIGERVVDEQVPGEHVIDNTGVRLDPPSLPEHPAPVSSDEVQSNSETQQQVPVDELKPESENVEGGGVAEPMIDALPDSADFELLPAPVPTRDP